MENFRELLKEEVKKYNKIDLTDKMLERFEIYKNLLLEWNEKINLTAITGEHDIILKHFVDSLEIVKYIKEGQSIIDVGTGGGFPGIVIAIYFNGNLDITLLDALDKRIKFLNEVIKILELKNVKTVHGRAEELSNDQIYREKFDISTARAVSSLNTLLEFNSPFVKVEGKCLLLKGEKIKDEILISKKALEILKCNIVDQYEYSYIVNNEEYKRYIVDIEKIGKTPNKYPRNFGKIKKNPL